MNQPLAALAALSVFCVQGNAEAQSSVTMFGLVDVAMTRGVAHGDGSSSLTHMTSSGNNTSRLGFRGVEDLGDGLRASFWLEGQLYPNTGAAGREGLDNNTTVTTPRGSGMSFTRRSTVSIAGNWGEVRLGRDLTPSHYAFAIYDPFNNTGVATSVVPLGAATGLNAGNGFRIVPAGQGTSGPLTRASNMASYLLPPGLGGIYGQVSYWLGETARNGAANEKDGTGGGLRLGYADRRLDVSGGIAETRYRGTPVATTAGAPSGDFRSWHVGATGKFEVVQLMAMYGRDERRGDAAAKGRGWLLGMIVPLGVGEIRASVSDYRIDAGLGSSPHARLLAAGYVHNLSKRTAVYGTYARVSNRDGSRIALGGSTIGADAGNVRSVGVDVGVRHNF